MSFSTHSALVLALAGLTGNAVAAISASAHIDFSSFSYQITDLDPNDNVTPTLTFSDGMSWAEIYANNGKNPLFGQWEDGLTSGSNISGSSNGANVQNSDSTLHADATLGTPSHDLHQLSAYTTKLTQFSLNGPASVVFTLHYTLTADDADTSDVLTTLASANLNGNVYFDDKSDSFFGTQQALASGSQSGVLQTSFSNQGSSAYGYLQATASVDIGDHTAPVPEPETYLMLLAGLGVVAYATRRRQH